MDQIIQYVLVIAISIYAMTGYVLALLSFGQLKDKKTKILSIFWPFAIYDKNLYTDKGQKYRRAQEIYFFVSVFIVLSVVLFLTISVMNL